MKITERNFDIASRYRVLAEHEGNYYPLKFADEVPDEVVFTEVQRLYNNEQAAKAELAALEKELEELGDE